MNTASEKFTTPPASDVPPNQTRAEPTPLSDPPHTLLSCNGSNSVGGADFPKRTWGEHPIGRG
jgi:hypothetical protein